LMVKPALPYLDIIADAAELAPDHPIACYQVSGEFAMIHAGARAGVYDLRVMAFETVESMVRAGTQNHSSFFSHQRLTRLELQVLRSFSVISLLISSTGSKHRSRSRCVVFK
jgi:porphobilinogen synthase